MDVFAAQQHRPFFRLFISAIAVASVLILSACISSPSGQSTSVPAEGSESGSSPSAEASGTPTPVATVDESAAPRAEPTPVATDPESAPDNGQSPKWPPPGGVDDCLNGLWVFTFEYMNKRGKIIRNNDVTGFCEEEIYLKAKSGNLWVDSKQRYFPASESTPFLMVLMAIDSDARACIRHFGPVCEQSLYLP